MIFKVPTGREQEQPRKQIILRYRQWHDEVLKLRGLKTVHIGNGVRPTSMHKMNDGEKVGVDFSSKLSILN